MSSAGTLDSARTLVDACVHCGICLDSCPTYVLSAAEPESPRGRIVLIADAIDDGGRFAPGAAEHLDNCLGCLACVSSCPSGVRYDGLLAAARPALEQQRSVPRSTADRLMRQALFQVLPRPSRMRRLLGPLRATRRFGSRLPPSVAAITAAAPRPPSRRSARMSIPHYTPAIGASRGRVGLLLGCVQRVFYPDVHRATIAVLAAEGFDVIAPALPDCCGALELHAGEEHAGARRAQATIDAFASVGGVDTVITSSAGCGSAMKTYGDLLGTSQARMFAPQVADLCEFLASVPTRVERGPLALTVAYHDACHLKHAQGISAEPRAMLQTIPGLELREVRVEPDVCCGAAGVYNVMHPDAAAELGARKAQHLLDTGVQIIVTANPGCAAQLARHTRALGRPLPVLHPIELLWRSIQSLP